MKKFLFLLIFIVSMTTSCSILQQTREYERFVQCDFSLHSFEITELSGIKLADIKTPDKLGMMAIMKLTGELMKGNITGMFKINISAQNYSGKTAAVSGFDWILIKKDQELFSGTMDQPVDIAPHDENIFPMVTEINILKLFDSQSLSTLINFVTSKDKNEVLAKEEIKIRIKPYYRLGSKMHKYPGYLTIAF